MGDKILKDRFHVSADELEHRTQKQILEHDSPIRNAVGIIEAALETVLKKLGVDVTGDIPLQQEQLGIIITEETRPEMAGLNGFFVSVIRKGDIVPMAWIGDAQLNSMGECSCAIHWFQEERMSEVGGIKLQ